MRNLLLIFTACYFVACTQQEQKPNIILIMADDMGYECLSINGSTEYSTPNLDRLSGSGIRFTNAFSQPLCTPTRVKIMTGKHNYRNYEYFGYLNPDQKTFGNLMKEAGYATCISGKWQLNGLSYELPGYEDTTRPNHFGFDEYCLWQLNRPRKDGERYANPLIYQNGEKLEGLEKKYGPDIFSDFVCDFIDRHVKDPFFIYYPMVLVHDPFVPTPDSEDWQAPEMRSKRDKKYFKDMVEYTDKVVAKIEQKLISLGLDQKTILIFTADNGTNVNITTRTINGPYPGGKSFTTQRGIHVPMLISWPGKMQQSGDFDGIVDFSDFYPTLAEIAGIDISDELIDGKSFSQVIHGNFMNKKASTLIHYDPEWGNASKNRNRFAMSNEYKLYRDGRFFNYTRDIDEKEQMDSLVNVEIKVRQRLQEMLDEAERESPWVEKNIDNSVSE